MFIITCQWNSESIPADPDVEMTEPEAVQCSLPGSENAPDVDGNYIEVVHHPHSRISTPTIIRLDADVGPPQPSSEKTSPQGIQRPWAPFRTRADFEYTATAVAGGLSADIVNLQLKGINNSWSVGGSMLTIHNSSEMAQSLAAAREYVIQFETGEISADFEGKTYTFQFQYRDPWKWILELVTDPSLAPHFKWYPVRKFLHDDGRKTQIYDGPNTGKLWWRVQDSLPSVADLPHCFVPAILWLDKGIITKHVRKHPIMGRLASLPSAIRNGSGNGGGVLFGYMIIVGDPADPDDRDAASTLAWARFRREVYHKVCGIIFKSLLGPARNGETVKCGDGIDRVLFPGIPYHSLDGEEACTMCACRAALTNFPCPRCLVPKTELHFLSKQFTLRTTATMKQVYDAALVARTKTDQERLLQSNGLHLTENFFWSLSNSDPYQSYTYDVLRCDDLGKWGKHLWPLLLQVLQQRGYKGRLAMNMASMPPWAGLKHFSHVTTIEYTDGQSFFDILKCILPCIVQLLPKKSNLVHCIRAYSQYRLMIGLHCTTEERIGRLNGYIKKYERFCQKVTKEHGKSFDFPKQHACAHVMDDLRDKGTTNHHTTRLGEGFHQEVKEAYSHTNGKNEDPQLARIDENQEAIALIQMRVNESDQAQAEESADTESDEPADDQEGDDSADRHWSCGSSMKWTTFNAKVRKFLADELSEQFGDTIMMRRHRCLYLKYQSCEDWTEKRDILRCNPKFHGNLRHDYALINTTDAAELACTHLYDLFTCKSLDGRKHDIALVSKLKPSPWRPNTVWDNCRVYEEPRETRLLLVKYLIRGAYMSPASDSGKDNLTYLVDTVDYDMFLRAGN
ncbi:hypothetical protein DFH07DRAFT_1008731 [Mycena maculata]|uniref:Uncharacterized protein n=1 Tax=Mycena maculata TaxID=230809 RepID=A0AAD7JRN2_9AGAR|nr:hypothetical protein DFH07DRAFT_1008731 [Mycena maculata]